MPLALLGGDRVKPIAVALHLQLAVNILPSAPERASLGHIGEEVLVEDHHHPLQAPVAGAAFAHDGQSPLEVIFVFALETLVPVAGMVEGVEDKPVGTGLHHRVVAPGPEAVAVQVVPVVPHVPVAVIVEGAQKIGPSTGDLLSSTATSCRWMGAQR